jgi:hypothetical protein
MMERIYHNSIPIVSTKNPYSPIRKTTAISMDLKHSHNTNRHSSKRTTVNTKNDILLKINMLRHSSATLTTIPVLRHFRQNSQSMSLISDYLSADYRLNEKHKKTEFSWNSVKFLLFLSLTSSCNPHQSSSLTGE